jgi:hypothetical protein
MALNFNPISQDNLTKILTEDEKFFFDHEDNVVFVEIVKPGWNLDFLATLSNFQLDSLCADALARNEDELVDAIDSILADREI